MRIRMTFQSLFDGLRRHFLLVVCVISAGFALWSANQYLERKSEELALSQQVPTVQRVVAARNLMVGEALATEDLAVRDYPKDQVNTDSLSPAQYYQLEEQVLAYPVHAGDLILPAHVAKPSPAAFSDQLQSGRRALTLQVDHLSSVAGLVRVGDLIDLYVSFDYQKRRITSPILQRVKILAVNQQRDEAYSEQDHNVKTLTLDVSPEEGVMLVAARQAGMLTAMLRHPSDPELSDTAIRGDLAALLGIAQPPISRKPKKAPVVYGNTQNRTLTALNPITHPARFPRAFFTLPDVWQREAEQLVSATNLSQETHPSMNELSFEEERYVH